MAKKSTTTVNYRCSFCGVAAIWTRKWTSFTAERIVKEIDHYVEKYGCKGIYFREDLFTTDMRRVENMCDLLLQREYKIKWACEARADITNPAILEKMSKSGCIGLYCGIESGSATGLLKKKKDLKQLRNDKKYLNFCYICIDS